MQFILIYTIYGCDGLEVKKEYFSSLVKMEKRLNDFNSDEKFEIIFSGIFYVEYKSEDVKVISERRLIPTDYQSKK